MIHLHNHVNTSLLSNYDDIQIQPNAIDLRLDSVYQIQPNVFVLDEEKKIHRGSDHLAASAGWYTLPVGSYEVVMQGIITIGEGEAGWVITRSTLNRNGVVLTSGLYDSGYSGVMAACMHVTTGEFRVKIGTRIGQFLLFKAETLHLYDGSYGLGTQDDNKYKGT